MLALSNRRDRIGSGAAALAVTGVLGFALVLGLAVQARAPQGRADIDLFAITPERADPPTKTHRMPRRDTRPSGRAAPPNLVSRATELAASIPIVTVPLPPPMIVAERPATGAQSTSGAAPVAGPGTGAGGQGDGFGGGEGGDGDGAGDPDATPPRQIRGNIRDSDYPDDLSDAGIGGAVTVVFLVAVDGRVTECDVDRSSGSARLDALTCRLIRERFRFRPSRDGQGRPVPSLVRETHEWIFERLPPYPD